MDIKIIYEDKDLMVIDKPARMIVFPEGAISSARPLINYLIEKNPKLADIGSPPRFGVVHRLDKDTSGILVIAKTNEALIFLQKQFKNREVEKKYVCMVEGNVKDNSGTIKTLIARSPKDPRKQKVYLDSEPHPGSVRGAITEYKVIERFLGYTLLEASIKTGRKHQIRCHLSYLRHPIAGDKMYGFKDSKTPEGLTRQFLHAKYLKIKLKNGETKEFVSELPPDLKNILERIKIIN